jgi:hypothetical protein
MKYLLSPVFFIFFCFRSEAQPDTDLASLPQETLHFYKPASTFPGNRFNHFEVIDERPDTARIGTYLITRSLFPNFDRQFVFGKPAADEIAQYLNRYFTRQDAPYTALIVLRSLWLSNANYVKREEINAHGKGYEVSHIRLRAEFYASRDSQYIPVFRYDTMLSNRSGYNPILQISRLEHDLSNLFINLADSASLMTDRKQNAGRRISRQEIRDFNRARFDKFADSNLIYASGVYASFEEFLNNKPSIQNYEIRTVKKDRLVYVKDAAGKSEYSNDAWGYSDGKTLYIMRDGSLCPTWRQGKAFYFYALSDKDRYTSLNANGLADTTPHPGQDQELCIYTLDTDTGDVY